MKRLVIYIFAVLLVSCNQLEVDFPKQSLQEPFLLKDASLHEPSILIIGAFSGKAQARMI